MEKIEKKNFGSIVHGLGIQYLMTIITVLFYRNMTFDDVVKNYF